MCGYPRFRRAHLLLLKGLDRVHVFALERITRVVPHPDHVGGRYHRRVAGAPPSPRPVLALGSP